RRLRERARDSCGARVAQDRGDPDPNPRETSAQRQLGPTRAGGGDEPGQARMGARPALTRSPELDTPRPPLRDATQAQIRVHDDRRAHLLEQGEVGDAVRIEDCVFEARTADFQHPLYAFELAWAVAQRRDVSPGEAPRRVDLELRTRKTLHAELTRD